MAKNLKKKRRLENGEDKETKKALLNDSNHTSPDVVVKNGSRKKKKHENESKEDKEKRKKQKRSAWSDLWKKCRLLWPYMWPAGDLCLQLRVIVCVVIIVITRGITVLVPLYYKKIVNSLTPQPPAPTSQVNGNHTADDLTAAIMTTGQPVDLLADLVTTAADGGLPPAYQPPANPPFCWDYILIFILLKSLHGGGGYLNCLRSFLWISVSQFTRKKMRIQLFTHLHSLSVRWHLQRKTGEVLRVMDRGVNSINLILSHVLFNIAPVIADIIIAIVFFVTMFNVWTGLIVFTTMIGYLVFTIVISEWRTKFRRQMNDTDNDRNATSVDSILNFETVKYYSAEEWEVKCYEKSVDNHLSAEWSVNATANLLNAIQRAMMMLGLLGGAMLAAWHVHTGRLTLGDFVLFLSYVEQLYGPLNMFGAYYRTLQQAFVDMENMFDMMEEKLEIVDAPGAPDLAITRGEIEFDNVVFHYNPAKPIMRGVSFVVPPGQTFALVGHSGGGKSTVIRLLFRFYDIQGGAIRIDGQDISKVTQKSLRRQVGVVPQDTVLFNRNIRENIRYGRQDATDTEVEEAAKAADIHDRIVTLPDGYSNRVGERGLKLSGGEKQRVAIARTILKAPQIVLLDEATSALDTRTERNIQASLHEVCDGKTTIIVAHRLSTIIHAHQILVIEEGQIVERGTHDELLREGGHYCEMWSEQLQSGEIADIDMEVCACCPLGAGQQMKALVDKELEEAGETPPKPPAGDAPDDTHDDLAPFDLGDITTATISGTADDNEEEDKKGDGKEDEKVDKNNKEAVNDADKDNKEFGGDADVSSNVDGNKMEKLAGSFPAPALKSSVVAGRERTDSRVLFTIPSENEEPDEAGLTPKVIECKCPCHDLVHEEFEEDETFSEEDEEDESERPLLLSRQTSVQGASLTDVTVATTLPQHAHTAPEPALAAPQETLASSEPLPPASSGGVVIATKDASVQVKLLDDLFEGRVTAASHGGARNPRRRLISRTVSVSERRMPAAALYSRTYSIYDPRRRGNAGGNATTAGETSRDRSRTVSSGYEDLTQSAGPRLLQRALSRQTSVSAAAYHARCRAKEDREKERERRHDRDNANRLSVKDHEHFSVSIDDLNAATEQYYRDSEDNAALKNTLPTPTDDVDSGGDAVFVDVVDNDDEKTLTRKAKDSADVAVHIEDV